MPSLLTTVFILQLLIHLINTTGAATINSLVRLSLTNLMSQAHSQQIWMLYNKVPTPTSKAVRDQSRLRSEVLRLKKEMNSTSSQDEFAKWAKLRRQHDKVLADYDKTSLSTPLAIMPVLNESHSYSPPAESLKGSKASFDSTVTVARWLSTNGLRFFLQFWYARQALFWIPQGWLPSYVEWMLSFPRSPRGSISIQVWGIACASVIQLVGGAVVALYVLAMEQRAGKGKGRPQKLGARGTSSAARSQARTPDRKKEL
ncbi:MAG: GET complex subunit get1 [Candelina submexicana]|nr:MAG: GET complex subunit get1 [Candelina submexicana]